MKTRYWAALVLAVIGLGAIVLFMRPERKAMKVDGTGLKSQLAAAAERGLPTPTLEMPELPTPAPVGEVK